MARVLNRFGYFPPEQAAMPQWNSSLDEYNSPQDAPVIPSSKKMFRRKKEEKSSENNDYPTNPTYEVAEQPEFSPLDGAGESVRARNLTVENGSSEDLQPLSGGISIPGSPYTKNPQVRTRPNSGISIPGSPYTKNPQVKKQTDDLFIDPQFRDNAEQNALNISDDVDTLVGVSEASKRGQLASMPQSQMGGSGVLGGQPPPLNSEEWMPTEVSVPTPPDGLPINNGQTYDQPNPTYDVGEQPEFSSLDGIGESARMRNLPTRPRVAEGLPINSLESANSEIAPTETDTERYLREYKDLDKQPLERKKSMFRRIGSGIKNAFLEWRDSGGEGGLAGLVGAIASGGLTSAISPNAEAEMSKDRAKKRMFQKYREARGLETEQNKQTEEFAKAQKSISDAQKSGTDAIKSAQDAKYNRAKPFLDSIEKKGYFTPEEVDYVRNVYGLDMRDPNNGRFEEFTGSDGKRYMRRVNSPIYAVNPTAPIDETKVVSEIKIDGDDFKLTDSQAASTKVGVAQANVGREERKLNRIEDQKARQEKEEKDAKEKDSENQRRFNEQKTGKIIEAQSRRKQAEARLRSLQTAKQTAIENGQDTTSIDTQIANADGEIEAAKSEESAWSKQQYKSYRQTETAPKTKPKGKAQGGKKQLSHSEAVDYLMKKNGWTKEKAEAKLKAKK